jgi:hypothetical protein
VESFFAGFEIEVLARVEADEFAGADDLDFEGHRLRSLSY